MFAAEGYGAVAWGFLYNTFAFADMAIALVVGVLLLLNSAFLKVVNQTTLGNVTLQAPATQSDASDSELEEIVASDEESEDK